MALAAALLSTTRSNKRDTKHTLQKVSVIDYKKIRIYFLKTSEISSYVPRFACFKAASIRFLTTRGQWRPYDVSIAAYLHRQQLQSNTRL